MSQRSKNVPNENKTENEEEASTSFGLPTENSGHDDPNVAEVVLSNKGGPKLIHNGYMYTLHKKQPYNIRWRCVSRSMHCRGSLITTSSCTKPRVRMEHNHKPDFAAAQVARKRYLALGKPCVLSSLEKSNSSSTVPMILKNEDLKSEQNEDQPKRRTARKVLHNILLASSGTQQQLGYEMINNGCISIVFTFHVQYGGRLKDAREKRGAVYVERSGSRSMRIRAASPSEPNVISGAAETSTTAATAGRLVLVACKDTVKLTARRLLNEQRDEDRGAVTSSTEDIVEGIRLEEVAMKQEPEDEEDCYLEATDIPSPSPPSSGSHHAGSTHRVRSHARSLRAMTNPSAVWAHFDLCANDPLRAQCRICGAVVVRGGANPRQCGTTNLHRHLRVHHGGRLIGSRYHGSLPPTIPPSLQSTSQSNPIRKTIRIATQSVVRPMRNIAPAPMPPQQQLQHQRQPKTLVLKTIPLKVKQVAPTTIKMPPRQIHQGLPHNIVHQQPTEVCLRWNSYHSNMQNSFPSLLDSEQFVDVTLACEGRSLKCHKMILSSCSDYLAQLLRENPCQHPIILMKDLKFWEVEALVKFMYRGEVNVAHDKLPQLLIAAETLQVKGLAGPSPSSQNPKPPLLIPQSKLVATQPLSRPASETKEKASTSGVSTPSSPKRAQKRQYSEPIEPKPFTKIRLQRPVTPTSPTTTVKMEPLDIPLSPTIFPENNEEDSSTRSNFEKLMSLHDEDDPGGNETIDGEGEINFCEIPEPPDINDSEDQMEFVPTDFLEQEQDIVEETETASIKDSKEEESRDYSSVELEDGERSEVEKDEPSEEKKPV
ncbi:Protein bric-a-brac 2 [Dufourea novaeangliae]|uniref:Protein bric-a-brac 2 n=1 Tax=Dufourea novaeangliae TaxID=178035 RepID=A0A154PEH9_DUFNO|nr:Protein bric-a-brac 2 [Dufourea novaeangliae]